MADTRTTVHEKNKTTFIVKNNKLVFLFGYITGFVTAVAVLFFVIKMWGMFL